MLDERLTKMCVGVKGEGHIPVACGSGFGCQGKLWSLYTCDKVLM